MKTCSHCTAELTEKTGYLRGSGPEKGKLKNLCRACAKENSRSWVEQNYERAMATRKRYHDEHPEAHRRASGKYNLNFRRILNSLKSERPCYDCGSIFPPECMDFDHVRGTKLFGVSAAAGKSWDEVRSEIDKCDLVCACCHRTRTQKRFHETLA